MRYAFRVFAAIYGHRVVEAPGAEVRCFYGRARPANSDARMFHIPARYEAGGNARSTVFLKYHSAGSEFLLSLGVDQATRRPDWLGEIFLWLSGGYETGITTRDSIGRIPYAETIFRRNQLPVIKPHAARLMAWLENAMRHGAEMKDLAKAPSPVPGIEHLVVCSHDIDFYFTSRASGLLRLAKNLGIAALVYRSPSFFGENLRLAMQLLGGIRVGDYLPALIERNERHNVHSTIFAVSRHGHRRDPNYRIDRLAADLKHAASRGFSVGVHGSYRSVMEDRSLQSEALRLGEVTGQRVSHGRQHWLRFGQLGDLFAEVAKSRLLTDSSLGFPDMVGFRNGASFAFPPYDFERETAHSFLEIPLVLMDGSLRAAARELKVPAQSLAEQVLRESRNSGWGGVAVLWHNPIEPLSVPAAINDVFWRCADQQNEFREKWISADQFLAASLERYQRAGLLQDVCVDAQPAEAAPGWS